MRLMSALSVALSFGVLALTACSSNAEDGARSPAATNAKAEATAAARAPHPLSGLDVVPLTVSRNGRTHTFQVEVARTSAEQARGLMFRTALGANEGMIFPMNPPRHASFWMRNTVIPLDIIYIGTDGRVMNMWENTVPYSEEPLPSNGMVKGVLELRGGRAKQLGIMPGDRVAW